MCITPRNLPPCRRPELDWKPSTHATLRSRRHLNLKSTLGLVRGQRLGSLQSRTIYHVEFSEANGFRFPFECFFIPINGQRFHRQLYMAYTTNRRVHGSTSSYSTIRRSNSGRRPSLLFRSPADRQGKGMNFDGIGGSSDLVLELVALDDGVGARDGVAAGGAEVEGARVPLRVPVHAAEGGAAAAREPRQAHALPAAGAPAGLGACSRGRRRLGLGRDRRGGRMEGRRGRNEGARWCWLLLLLRVQVAVALGAEVQRRGAAEEAAVVGAQAVALLPPLLLLLLLLRHGRRTEPREREEG